MVNYKELQMLEALDPLNLSTEQQCAYVLKCLENELQPDVICGHKFRGDNFTFDLIMTMVTERGWARQHKRSGKWIVKK